MSDFLNDIFFCCILVPLLKDYLACNLCGFHVKAQLLELVSKAKTFVIVPSFSSLLCSTVLF